MEGKGETEFLLCFSARGRRGKKREKRREVSSAVISRSAFLKKKRISIKEIYTLSELRKEGGALTKKRESATKGEKPPCSMNFLDAIYLRGRSSVYTLPKGGEKKRAGRTSLDEHIEGPEGRVIYSFHLCSREEGEKEGKGLLLLQRGGGEEEKSLGRALREKQKRWLVVWLG